MSAIRHLTLLSVNLFILTNIFVSPYERKVNVQLNSVKCSHDPKIFNGSVNCSITSFPNGTQLETALYKFNKPCDDLWSQVVVYFKNKGSYKPFIINFDENVCSAFKGYHEPTIFSRLLYRVTDKIAPNVIHKCPYVGEEGINKINGDRVFATLIPFVVPTGDYRFLFRFHTTSNKTFLEVLFDAHIEAINQHEAVSMNTFMNKLQFFNGSIVDMMLKKKY